MIASRVALVARLAIVYFASVFAIGFLLGAARAGSAYAIALLLFAAMPAAVAR